ncbi:MAG: diacylglycerol kinase [Pseudomonadota bacterium]
MKSTECGLAHLRIVTQYSMQDLWAAWRYEQPFRQEALTAVVSIPLAFVLARNTVGFVTLILPLLMLVAAELGYSAIETVIDRLGEEHRELSGRAQDLD